MSWSRTFWELETSTRWWDRLRVFLHYHVFHHTLYRLPWDWGWRLRKAGRRNLYGPDVNYEDLNKILASIKPHRKTS